MTDVFATAEAQLSIKQRFRIAKARSQRLLQRLFDESQHPRDEHGRWTDSGGGGAIDTDKVEAKTEANVTSASALAKANGIKPLAGSKGEHPNAIATRNPTGKGAAKGVYGQPDVASMKLDPKRYDHDIGLFKNANFYPNFRAADFAGSTDQATAAVVDQMKSNLKYLYEHADKSTQVWYDGARALVDDRVKLFGFNDASTAAVYAALSPTKDWDQNVHIADMLMQTYKNQQDHRWDKAMDDKSKTLWSAKLQPAVDLVRGKTLGELKSPAEKAMWIRTYDETHNDPSYRTVLPNGALGPVTRNKDGTPSKVVWQSLPAITNAVKALEANGDPAIISESMGNAHKVRSFYNNILDPHSANGDVTIDTHAVGAALLRQLSGSTAAVLHNFGNAPMKADKPEGWEAAGSSVKTGLSGLYPVYAQAYREAAHELGIQPRQLQSAVWVVKRDTFGELSKKTQGEVEQAWRDYHDNPKITLPETQQKIGLLIGLEKHERSYRDDERIGRPGDARELHRDGVGPAAAGVERRAGGGVAGRAAGLVAVRTEERRDGTERLKLFDEGQHPRDEHGRWTDSGGGDSSTSAARPKTTQGKGASDKAFAKIKAAVNAIPPGHAAQIEHVPVVLTETSDDFPSHIAAGGGASTVGLFSWTNNQPRIDVAEAIKVSATITQPAPNGQPAQSVQTESLLPIRQPEQVTVHELAHAFDYVNDWKPSAHPVLNQSFAAAIKQMTETEAKNANYWISGGQREMFAELYSALYNPNRASDQTYFGGMTHQRVEQVFAPAIAHVLQIKRFRFFRRSPAPPREEGNSGWFVNDEGCLYALLNGMPYEVDVTGTPFAKLQLVPGSYTDDAALVAAAEARQKSWHLARAQAERLLARGKGDVVALVKIRERAEAKLATGHNGLYKVWNEDDHPRAPAGGPDGGEFTGGGGSGGGGSGAAAKPQPTGTGAGAGNAGGVSQSFSRESAGDAERSRNVVAVYTPTPAAAKAMRAQGHTPLTFHELDSKGAQTFYDAIVAAKSGKYGSAVHAYSADEYKGMRLFLTPDHSDGFALKGDDIVSVFKFPKEQAKGVATTMLALATEQGGRRLDCFDTQLPFLYAKSGFTPVARLKWNEEYKPEGWDKETFKEFNKGEPDVVFMVHSATTPQTYTPGDSGYVADYDAGNAAQHESTPSIPGYRPGVRGRGNVEVKARRDEWVKASPIKTIGDVIRAAPIAQKALGEAGRRIAEQMGIAFKDPGPKTSSAKGIARTEQKIAERNGLVARVTDTARGAFILTKPEQADAVIRALGRTHEVLAEPWRTIPETHYTDRALLVRDRQTGLIAEVQITEPRMVDAKKAGHPLYEQSRSMPARLGTPPNDKPNPKVLELEAQQRAIYDPVLDSYHGTDWQIVDGRTRVIGS